MVAKYSVLALALALTASALQITRPSNETGWVTEGANVIEWDSVSTDPSNFTIQLINPSSPNDPVTIAENVQSADGSYTYSPSSALTAANQYRVNFVSPNAGILAQSNYFEVEQGTSSVSASSSSASATSSSSASGSSASGAASSATSAASSASSSAAASASQTGAASMLIAPTGLLALVAAALGVLA